MKYFIYLVQGQACYVKKYLHLADRVDADVLFLTYDYPLEVTTISQKKCIYLPNSTWTEGRNKLLEIAINQAQSYQYYIFLDDDVEFIRGTWDLFEAEILYYKPAIAIPVFPNTTNSPVHLSKVTDLPILRKIGLSFQAFLVNDQQLIAFHRDVINDGIILPYQTKFDSISWWAACEIQDILIQNLYPSVAIQFNLIELSNDLTERYKDSHQGGLSYKILIRTWLEKSFSNSYQKHIKDVNYGNVYPKPVKYGFKLLITLWRTFLFVLLFKCAKSGEYKLSPHEVLRYFRDNSVFTLQYQSRRSTLS